ncbi:MAG: hypothetical protein HY507_01745 [Candidatus Zambryskibacteria bacterium]|nr:hypothetical protein [Candidatus Zambryskibacteria bacterium]
MNSEEKSPPRTLGENPIKSLRTYQGDIDEILAKGKTSISSIAIDEQKRRERSLLDSKKIGETEKVNKFFVLIGVMFLLLGAITVISVYYIKSNQKVAVEQKTKALIGYSEEKILPAGLGREQLMASIIKERQLLKLPVNSVLYLNITEQNGLQTNIQGVLALIAPAMPPFLSRSFENQYMLGVYSFDTNEPFLILSTKDFATSYAGMLLWEKGMISDIGNLFSITENGLGANAFQDKTVRNKDLRVLKDVSGKTVLLYSFVDKNTLIITSNENVFEGLLGKYVISKTER